MPLSVDNALLTTTNSTRLIEDEKAEQTAKVWQIPLMRVND